MTGWILIAAVVWALVLIIAAISATLNIFWDDHE